MTAIDALYRFMSRRPAHYKILFWPEYPHHHRYLMTKLIAKLRLYPVQAGEYHLAMLWDERPVTKRLNTGQKLINGSCSDISIGRLKKAFGEVFGYPTVFRPATITEQGIRIVVVGDQLPLAYLDKRKLVATDRAITKAEKHLILILAREIGLDFGEFDAIRDGDTSRLFITGVTKTAFGPPVGLNFFRKRRAVNILAKAFEMEFMDRFLVRG